MSTRRHLARPSVGLPSICWRCALRWQTASHRSRIQNAAGIRRPFSVDASSSRAQARAGKEWTIKKPRRDSTGSRPLRSASAGKERKPISRASKKLDDAPPVEPVKRAEPRVSIRELLRIWQEEHKDDMDEIIALDLAPQGSTPNMVTRATDRDAITNESTEPGLDSILMENGEVTNIDSSQFFLRRGDLVELTYGSSPVLAIYIREFENQSQFYTMKGGWVSRTNGGIYFSIPGFAPDWMTDPILPHMPVEKIQALQDKSQSVEVSVPRDAGRLAVKAMLEFWDQSEATHRRYATILDNAHRDLADEEETRFATADEISEKLLGDSLPSKVTLYAIHKALRANEYGFSVDLRNHRVSGEFRIRPKKELALVNTVREWIREYREQIVLGEVSGPIAIFASKARRLVSESRELREMTPLGLGPSPQKLSDRRIIPSLHFTRDDRSIIQFLETWCCSRAFIGHATLSALGPLILRAVGMYDDINLDVGVGYMFLQEMGVLSPWQNRVFFDPQLGLPGHAISRKPDEMYRMVQKAEFDDEDAMHGLRKDWGDLPVYCIDDAGAREIDDGISVEGQWVHIHIANPSAFLDPDEVVAKYAAHMTQTIYLPELHYPMLPSKITEKASLAPNRPALTFSAKLSDDGEILEYKISPGIVRNVISLTYSTLRRALGSEETTTSLKVGDEIPSKGNQIEELDAVQLTDLNRLEAIAAARRRLRSTKGGLTLSFPSSRVSVSLGGWPTSPPSHIRGNFFEGDPTIEIRDSSSATFVADMMNLACEVAGRWCAEKKIPVYYRGTINHPDRRDPTEFQRTVLQPLLDHSKEVPLGVALDYFRLSRGVALTTPLRHAILGVDVYAKCTSPLRRYTDLVLHWQIEAVLRQEAELPFSKAQLDENATKLEAREKMLSRAQSASEQYWVCQALFRAFYFKEAPLPDTFEFLVRNDGSLSHIEKAEGYLKMLAINVSMIRTPMAVGIGVDVGDRWQVKLHAINPYTRVIDVEPVRLLSRDAVSFPVRDSFPVEHGMASRASGREASLGG